MEEVFIEEGSFALVIPLGDVSGGNEASETMNII